VGKCDPVDCTLLSIILAVLVYWRKPGDLWLLFSLFYLLQYAIVFTGRVRC
jgi:hypothetical protein